MTDDSHNMPSPFPMRYTFKPSFAGTRRQCRLLARGLEFSAGDSSRFWPYSEIASIRLTYRPVSMQSRRFRADIRTIAGLTLPIVSTNWRSIVLVEPQDKEYRAFIVDLHRRLIEAGSSAICVAGLKRPVYAVALTVAVAVVVALFGLFIRSLIIEAWSAALLVVGFAALFAWQ